MNLNRIKHMIDLRKIPEPQLPDHLRFTFGESQQSSTESTSEQRRALADLSTNLWRTQKRLSAMSQDNYKPAELDKIRRPIQSAVECLQSFGVAFKDHTGDKYDSGMAVNVVSCQPKQGIEDAAIAETLKPSVFLNGKLIQQADVIVDEPAADQPTQPNGGR